VLFLIESECGHVGPNKSDSVLLGVEYAVTWYGFFFVGIEVNKIGLSSLLGAVSGEMSNFPILEAGVIGVTRLTITCNVCMISLSLALESSVLELSSLLVPQWCPFPT
jgi:hypothetical protein